jgi:hypothetical protein
MALANAIETHHVVQFAANVEMLLSQSGYRLRQYVRTSTKTGKSASLIDQIGTMSVQRDRGRNTPTVHSFPTNARRWAYPILLTTATLVDDTDLVKMLIDPKSAYVEQMVAALGRGDDDEISRAFFDVARTGENGSGTVSFPAAQSIAATVGGGGPAVGLNVAKLRAAKRLFMQSGLDLSRERLYMAITAIEHDNLLGELAVTSTDFNDKPTLVDGRVTSFMGFSFVHIEFQSTDDEGAASYPTALPLIAPGGLAGTTRNLPAWTMSGMHMADWKALQTRISDRPDMNHATQLHGEMMVGASRLQEKKVVQVICTST